MNETEGLHQAKLASGSQQIREIFAGESTPRCARWVMVAWKMKASSMIKAVGGVICKRLSRSCCKPSALSSHSGML